MVNIKVNRTILLEASSTATARFPNQPCRYVMFRNGDASAQAIRIHGVDGAGTPDQFGLNLPVGASTPVFYCDNLNQFAWQADNQGDQVEILLGL